MSTEETQRPPEPAPRSAQGVDDQGRDRPDLRGPRGNQEVEQIDVDRGIGKIERIVSW